MKAYIVLKSFTRCLEAMNILNSIAQEIVIRDESERPDENELIELVKEYDILIIGVKEMMTEIIYSKCIRLKYLCTLSIGVDHISEPFFNSEKIKVISCKEANVQTVAEFILSYILFDLKKIIDCDSVFREGKGREGLNKLPEEISSKKIGVIGAGRIATRLFDILTYFRCPKFCWTLHPEKHNDLLEKGVAFKSINDIVFESDYLCITIPYTDKTHYLLNEELLNKAKKSLKIVSVSRVNIIDLGAFFKNLNDGKFHGSLIDCFPDEIVSKNRNIDKVFFSPHVAGISEESRQRMLLEVMKELELIIGL